jgi:hypothetical protein
VPYQTFPKKLLRKFCLPPTRSIEHCPAYLGFRNLNEITTKTLPLDNKKKVCKCHFPQGRIGELSMSEFFRVASIAEYQPNESPLGVVGVRHSSLLVQDEVTLDDFSTAMLLGANFRNSPTDALGFVSASQLSKSPMNVGPALQPSTSPQQRLDFALAQSRSGSITPSWAEGVANHATVRN